jgi:hypothetical protein
LRIQVLWNPRSNYGENLSFPFPDPFLASLWAQSCVCAAFGYLQQPIVAQAISSGSFTFVNLGLLVSQVMLLVAVMIFKKQHSSAS